MAQQSRAARDASRDSSATSALAFTDVTVIDVTDGRRLDHQTVLIVGNRIRAVGRAQRVRIPKDAKIVDARGKYMIPGLWDMHTHATSDREYALLIASGITGIRNAGSDVPLERLRQHQRDILAGERVGPPRQLLSGLQVNDRTNTAGCPETGVGLLAGVICASTPADMRRVVDSLKAAGADMIKTYLMTPEMHFALATEARRAGLLVGGHTHTLSAMEFSDSGGSILDHVRNSGNPRGVASVCLGDAATVERCRPLAERFAKNGTWWAPTLIRSLASSLNRVELEPGPAFDAVRARVLETSQRLEEGMVPSQDWLRDASRTAAPDSVLFLAVVQRAGVPILAGTDDDEPGLSLHGELAIYVAEGLTPLNALQSATLNPAKMLRATDSLGTVAPRKLADLVLLDADPLVAIENTTTIWAVVANGRYFDRAALDRMIDAHQGE